MEKKNYPLLPPLKIGKAVGDLPNAQDIGIQMNAVVS